MPKRLLRRVRCIPECGFMVQTRDREEIIHFVADHARKSHNIDLQVEDIKKKIIYV